ncbi:MAG: hypothetical protein LC740_07240, partial [Actinobacteria bacterium]|nr:hypothetical protein [Actinomycetota bacterium]
PLNSFPGGRLGEPRKGSAHDSLCDIDEEIYTSGERSTTDPAEAVALSCGAFLYLPLTARTAFL